MAVSLLKEALELDPDYGRAKAQARRSLKTISVGQRTNRTAACGLMGAVGCPQTCQIFFNFGSRKRLIYGYRSKHSNNDVFWNASIQGQIISI
jgi:hypothetical protein